MVHVLPLQISLGVYSRTCREVRVEVLGFQRPKKLQNEDSQMFERFYKRELPLRSSTFWQKAGGWKQANLSTPISSLCVLGVGKAQEA